MGGIDRHNLPYLRLCVIGSFCILTAETNVVSDKLLTDTTGGCEGRYA